MVIDKPAGLTSHDVVNRVRHLLHVRRVGHTGTLDPFATGLMVILVGRATRLAQFLSGLEKEYEAKIRLGYATDTGDGTGTRIPEPLDVVAAKGPWSRDQIEAALESLRGEIDQVPPMYSAKKQAGKKLYELARKGLEVERPPVRVCIYAFEPLRPMDELLKDNLDGTFDFEVRVACSAGTYVRTLAEDFGKRLNVGAHLTELRRTQVGDFSISVAKTLEQVKTSLTEEALGTILSDPDAALSRLSFVDLDADDIARVKHGLDVRAKGVNWGATWASAWADGERVRLRDVDGNLLAVAEFRAADESLHPSVVIPAEPS
ncbi:MAG TPA: tRNA pseudouridine(55) synthase TruB [Pyrinomonadaceae bacterium]|nr:tRNA pseudouridine(55) synthase TruB [Pyrinomonadaceae bacterium]